jgi:hypothetical protein
VLQTRTLDRRTRGALVRADAAIAHAQLTYVGKSDPGVKGLVFRTVGALSIAPMKQLVSRVVGKGLLPIGVKHA